MSTIYEAFMGALETLTNQGVRVFMLRGVEATLKRILERPSTGDIDILVMPENVDLCVTVIRRELERQGHVCAVRRIAKGSYLRAIPCDMSREECYEFHVVGYISMPVTIAQRIVPGYSRKVTLDELPSKVVAVRGLSLLEPTEQLAFILAYLQWMKKRNQQALARVQEAVRPAAVRSWLESVLPVGVGTLLDPRQAGTLWAIRELRKLIDHLIGRDSRYQLAARHRACLTRAIVARWMSGHSVFFSGPDGAGKTTCLVELTARLERLGIDHQAIYSLQVGTVRFGRGVRSVRARLRGELVPPREQTRFSIRTEGRDRDTGKWTWRARRFIGLAVGLIDIILLGRIKLLECRIKGQLALVETAPLDIFVKRHRPRHVVLERLLARFVPRATISFLLTAAPERIVERKPELTADELEDYYLRMNHLISTYASGTYVSVPTDRAIEESIRLVGERVLSLYR